jgi:NAD+ diphosphatase
MFQDIAPHKLNIAYIPKKPQVGDYLLFTQGDNVLMVNNGEKQTLPQYGTPPFTNIDDENSMQYLLSVDENSVFYVRGDYKIYENTTWQRNTFFRMLEPAWMAFAVATAFHIVKWYDRNLYCGHCKTPMEHLAAERTLRCPACDVKEHPKISPVIIAGVFDGDWLLLTKYATGEYLRFTLIAGFGEIGETFEDIVRREVMEEVGLEVDTMYYYGSQPWGFSQSLLAGFFVKGDRSKKITMDAHELKEAVWIHKDEMPYEDDVSLSLTWNMIEAFRRGWKPT